jgi:hypothetical protein
MKTIIIRSADNTTRVEVKADIFATTAQLQTPGFDTRFTGMEIVDTEAAIVAGINVTEIEQNWQGMIYLATSLSLGLYVIDLNDAQTGEIEIVAPV